MHLVYAKVREPELEYAVECHCRVCHASNNFRPGGRPSYEEFRRQFRERGVWEESRMHLLRSLQDARTLLDVADTRAGERVGFYWVVFSDWYEHHWAEINDIYVEERFRRRGAATEMLSHIEAEVRRLGAEVLNSGTGVDNVASQRMHERYGFTPRRYEYQIWLD